MLKKTFHIRVFVFFIVLSSYHIHAQNSEIPFKSVYNGLILVQAVVEDSITGNFILDTGSGIHVFSKKFSDRIKMKNAGFFTAFRHNGERISLDIYTISNIAIGEAVERNPYVGILDALDNLGLDGIISLKLFEKQPFTINFINKTINHYKHHLWLECCSYC